MKRILISLCLIFIFSINKTFALSSIEDLISPNNRSSISLNIPVITYHLISDDSKEWSEYCISPQKLENDLALINSYGYKPISISELSTLYSLLSNPIVLKNPSQVNEILLKYKNAIVLTSDDGYNSNFNYIYPLIKKYNIKFNFFIVSNFIGTNGYLTKEEITQMALSSLIEFGNHSNELHNFSKAKLQSMYNEEQSKQYILNDYIIANDVISSLIKKKPNSISYPYGVYTNTLDNQLKSKGFDIRFTTNGGVANPFSSNTNIGRINRSNRFSSDDLMLVIKKAIN